MFLFIFEDGSVMKGNSFSAEDAQSCDFGVLDVIDIAGDEPKQFFDGGWHDLKSTEEISNFE